MIKPVFSLALLVLMAATMTSANDGGQQTPTIYDRLGKYGLTRVMDFGCNVREILKDRQSSDHIYKLWNGARQILGEGLGCVRDFALRTINDKTKPIGSFLSQVRFGQTSEIRYLSDILSTIPNFIMMNIMAPRSIDVRGMVNQANTAAKEVIQECGGKKFDAMKPDLEFLIEKYRSLKQSSNVTNSM